jgi:hypothetical protein
MQQRPGHEARAAPSPYSPPQLNPPANKARYQGALPHHGPCDWRHPPMPGTRARPHTTRRQAGSCGLTVLQTPLGPGGLPQSPRPATPVGWLQPFLKQTKGQGTREREQPSPRPVTVPERALQTAPCQGSETRRRHRGRKTEWRKNGAAGSSLVVCTRRGVGHVLSPPSSVRVPLERTIITIRMKTSAVEWRLGRVQLPQRRMRNNPRAWPPRDVTSSNMQP